MPTFRHRSIDISVIGLCVTQADDLPRSCNVKVTSICDRKETFRQTSLDGARVLCRTKLTCGASVRHREGRRSFGPKGESEGMVLGEGQRAPPHQLGCLGSAVSSPVGSGATCERCLIMCKSYHGLDGDPARRVLTVYFQMRGNTPPWATHRRNLTQHRYRPFCV